jgi:DNA polymerase elongation subunit (family B)
MKLMRVTWVDYVPKHDDEADPTVRVCGRSADGERVIRYVEGTRPHLFADPADTPLTDIDDVSVHGTESGYETIYDQPVDKVTVGHPKQVNRVKEELDWTAEADIPYYRRATWDYGLSGYIRVPENRERCDISQIEADVPSRDVETINPRTVIGDIEVKSEDDKSFDEMQEAVEDPIVAVSLYDTHTEQYVLAVVDGTDRIEGSDVKQEMEGHWEDHDLADKYVDDADISLIKCDSEVDLLNTVIARIQDWQPDILSGWNWIDFDHGYITERAKKLSNVDEHKLSDIGSVGGRKVETRIDGVVAFDEMRAYEDKVSWSENRSSRLGYVAAEEIGIGKIPAVDVTTAYEEDRARLAAYNLLDVQLCVALTEKHQIEEFYLDLADLTGLQVYDCYYEKRLVDGYIAVRKDDDEVYPNQSEEDIATPAGGMVLSPSDGIEEDVAVVDLKSLYPSSMITANISPEKLTTDLDEADVIVPGMPEKEDDVGGRVEPSDITWEYDESLPWSQRAKGFKLDDEGILPKYLKELFKEREEYKSLRDGHDANDPEYDVYDRKQRAIKVVMNSFYGVSNSPYYRLAQDGVGDAITGVSRYVLWKASERAEELGYEVIYGDTDSCIISLSDEGEDPDLDELLDRGERLSQELNEYMDAVADDLGLPDEHPFLKDADLHGDQRQCWVFEYEKLYRRFVQFGSKKRYAGKLQWKEGKEVDKIDIVGFESQRSDVPQMTERVQRGVLNRVLSGKGFDDVSWFVSQNVDIIREQDTDIADIGIPMSLDKKPEDYGNLPRARAAEHSNKHLGYDFGPGDTPWVYYVSRTPFSVEGTDVIGIEWNESIPEGYELDQERTIIKAFESALDPILDEMGWTFSEIRDTAKTLGAADESVTEYDGDPFAERSDDDEEEAGEKGGAAAW